MSVLNPFKLRMRGADAGKQGIQVKAKSGSVRSRSRIMLAMGVVFAVYGTIGGRLVQLGMTGEPVVALPQTRPTASRPDILDRNGQVLATDIKTASLFAEPRRIVDIDEAIEKLRLSCRTSITPKPIGSSTARQASSGCAASCRRASRPTSSLSAFQAWVSAPKSAASTREAPPRPTSLAS